ncbi:unnamed protein product, partial [Urochloa humidicola]
ARTGPPPAKSIVGRREQAREREASSSAAVQGGDPREVDLRRSGSGLGSSAVAPRPHELQLEPGRHRRAHPWSPAARCRSYSPPGGEEKAEGPAGEKEEEVGAGGEEKDEVVVAARELPPPRLPAGGRPPPLLPSATRSRQGYPARGCPARRRASPRRSPAEAGDARGL